MDALVHDSSLGMTLAAADDYLSRGCELDADRTGRLIDWILSRQVRSGPHRGLLEPLPLDDPNTARTVLGERLHTRFGIRNTVSQEAARILWILGSERTDVRDAIQLASARMSKACYALHHCVIGECAHSSIGYLRLQAAVHPERDSQWGHRHLSVIRSLRDGAGRWNRVPFYYTLQCLRELENEGAAAELRYAIAACLRVANRKQPEAEYGDRRAKLVESILTTYSLLDESPSALFDEGNGSNR